MLDNRGSSLVNMLMSQLVEVAKAMDVDLPDLMGADAPLSLNKSVRMMSPLCRNWTSGSFFMNHITR